MSSSARLYDVVIYGATGFTGQLVVDYFAQQVGTKVAWAVAGRTKGKLEKIVASAVAINAQLSSKVGIVVADGSDPQSIDAMVQGARVILSTAGPFSIYSDPVVTACVKYGTDYVDITGESPWVRTLIDRHHETAAAKGVHIVPMCGFDSLPADLGALQVADYFTKNGKQTKNIHAVVSVIGGASGGTIASMMTIMEKSSADLVQPYLLNPGRKGLNHPEEKDQVLARYESDVGKWTAPFVMAVANTRVVRRSHALLQEAKIGYGPRFAYNESMECTGFVMAFVVAVCLAIGAVLFAFKPVRTLLSNFLPSPGQGPSAEARKKGFFRYKLIGTAEDGSKAVGIVQGGDPGYSETAKFVSEAALFLALEKGKAPLRGGVLTPATGMGLGLIERLKKAGIRFEVGPKK